MKLSTDICLVLLAFKREDQKVHLEICCGVMEGEGGHGSDETHELCNGTTITMLLVKIDINSTSVRFKDESFKWDVGLRTSITGQNIR